MANEKVKQTKASIVFTANVLALSGILDFDSVVDLEDAGSDWIANRAPQNCWLDLSNISYSSSAGLALLLVWLQVALQHKKVLVIENAPSDLMSMARLVGLDKSLPELQSKIK
jgi:anti-anti-sigma factor